MRIFPLILLGAGILMKPRLMKLVARTSQKNSSLRDDHNELSRVATAAIASPNAWGQAEDRNRDFEKEGVR